MLKALYKTAYEHLAAAAAMEKAEELHDAAVSQEEVQRVRAILDALPDREGECVKERRFLSAISCRGMLRMNKTVNLLCKQIYYLRGHAVLEQAAVMAERKAERMILCPRPLRPEQLEAVLLPEQGIALMRAPAAVRDLCRESLRGCLQNTAAKAAVEAAGFAVEITYSEGDGKANTVTKTEPAAGEKADPNSTVRLFVIEPMPTDPLHVLEYFGSWISTINIKMR